MPAPIDFPTFSVKLGITMVDGASYFGSGFYVSHKDKTWLITCRHNIEARTDTFSGVADADKVSIVGGQTLWLNDGRAVVGFQVGQVIADCVAIELRLGEVSCAPIFVALKPMPLTGKFLPESFHIGGPNAEERAEFTPTHYALFQGFPEAVFIRKHCKV